MSIVMSKQQNNKSSFFQKSPELHFAESPALSLFKGLSKNFLEPDNDLNLARKVSNSSIKRPSP